jgi:hypothetical protein
MLLSVVLASALQLVVWQCAADKENICVNLTKWYV